MPTKELEKTQTDKELAPLSDEEAALVAGVKSNFDQNDLILPQVRLTQPLSRAVQEGDAQAGEFVNTLTGENYGSEFDLVIASYFKGRFYSDDEGGAFVAAGDVAPENWPEKYAGQHFTDLPDAEEQYKAAANAGQHEWGGGPPIRTTYNYVGVIVSEGAERVPVRLSLQRTSTPTARKINSIIDMSRAPWDKTFHVEAEQRESKGRSYHIVDVKVGRPTEADERAVAVELARNFQQAQGNVQLVGDEEEKASKPAAREGSLDLD
jgi:hypothetical protein